MADKHEQGAGATVAAPIEADITLTEGPGAVGARFKLRDNTLTILLPRGEDGALALRGLALAATAHEPLAARDVAAARSSSNPSKAADKSRSRGCWISAGVLLHRDRLLSLIPV